MLRHLKSSLIISSVLPLGVLGAFILMRYFGVDANIMALSGIAIAIGTMVDMGIVLTDTFAGSYENQVRSAKTLSILVPMALAIIFLLIYLQFRRVTTTLSIFSGIAVAVAGGFLLIWLYGQPWFLNAQPLGIDFRELLQVHTVNLSVAVWVGFIALLGIATDDGVVMSTYLHQRFREGDLPRSIEQVRERTLDAGMRRVRPCMMTTATTLLALLPVVTSTGRGSDVMVPMTLPLLGGMSVEFITLFVVPILYCLTE